MTSLRHKLLTSCILGLCFSSCQQLQVAHLPAHVAAGKLDTSYEAFIASPNYRQTRDFWRGSTIEQTDQANSYVVILLKEQRGRLYINKQIAMDFPACTGRDGNKETPEGSYRITQKLQKHTSNLYGSFVDGDKTVKHAVRVSHRAPKGSKFKGAPMPYWMRFNGAIGMHEGRVYREGSSNGCVRIPPEPAKILYSKLGVGSRVIVR